MKQLSEQQGLRGAVWLQFAILMLVVCSSFFLYWKEMDLISGMLGTYSSPVPGEKGR